MSCAMPKLTLFMFMALMQIDIDPFFKIKILPACFDNY